MQLAGMIQRQWCFAPAVLQQLLLEAMQLDHFG
jgi:hypothetical protein